MATPPFAHGLTWYQTPNITARELAMLRFMADVVDEADWETHVFDTAYIESKRVNVLDEPKGIKQLLGTNAFEWCIKELQDKAREYTRSGLVHVYNTATTILKGDGLVSADLLESLNQDCQALAGKRKRPNPSESNNKTIDDCAVVDPTAYPLVWGRTNFLSEPIVNIAASVETIGTGQLSFIPPPSFDIMDDAEAPKVWQDTPLLTGVSETTQELNGGLETFRQAVWRSMCDSTGCGQWIPFDLGFTDENSSKKLQIQSYVNSVHPETNNRLYSSLEQLTALAIDLWNDVLHYQGDSDDIQVNSGVFPYRIKTWGVPWYDENQSPYCCGPCLWGHHSGCDSTLRKHWRHPDASESYSYDDWKRGATDTPVVPRISFDEQWGRWPEGQGEIVPDKSHEFLRIRLQEEYRHQGLQAFFQMTSIELDKNTPLRKGEDWRVEGLEAEHICAVFLLPLSMENVDSDYAIHFRIPTNMNCRGLGGDAYEHSELDEIFDTPSISNAIAENLSPLLSQELGPVKLKAGQVLAWPNSWQTRLPDLHVKGDYGNLRFLKIMLVDPHFRLCSTRFIPPQQTSWWNDCAHEILSSLCIGRQRRGIPNEIISMILNFASAPGLSPSENKQIIEDWRQKQQSENEGSFGGTALIEDRSHPSVILPDYKRSRGKLDSQTEIAESLG